MRTVNHVAWQSVSYSEKHDNTLPLKLYPKYVGLLQYHLQHIHMCLTMNIICFKKICANLQRMLYAGEC